MKSTRLLLALGLCVCLPATLRAQPIKAPPPPTVVERAKALSDQKQFATAQKLIKEQLGQNLPQEQRTLLQNTLADVQFDWGTFLTETKDYEQALPHFQAAYQSDKQLRPDQAGKDLSGVGFAHYALGHTIESIPDLIDCSVALTIECSVALTDEGHVSAAQRVLEVRLAQTLSQEQRALLQKALADVHFAWGKYLISAEDYEPALQHFQSAYESDNQLRPDQAGRDLFEIGLAYWNLGRFEESARSYKQALSLFQSLKDPGGESRMLKNLGALYWNLNRYEEAARFYNQALPLFHNLKDQREEAQTLKILGVLNWNLDHYQEALHFDNQALLLFRSLKDQGGESQTLKGLGNVYGGIGLPQQALRFFNQALLLDQQTKDQQGQADSLLFISQLHHDLGHNGEALRVSNQALLLYRNLNNKRGEAHTLSTLGNVYSTLGRHEEALNFLNQAFVLYQSLKDKQWQTQCVFNLGEVYRKLGRYEEALHFSNQALVLYRSLKDRKGEGDCLHEISIVYEQQKQPDLAIVYAKQAVNLIQSIRVDNQKLDKASQRSFLVYNRLFYKRLAALLVGQNRLEEAEQVLRFLRQEDAFEFARRDPALAKEIAALFQPLVYTSSEIKQLCPECAASATVGEGSEESRLWQQALGEREKAGQGRAALLSILNTDDTFYLLLSTAKGRRAFSVPIKKVDFDALSVRLQHALAHPDVDPRPDAQKMYQIVFAGGELEQALQEEGITIALWFTSGSLRTIPIDALYDGKQYLVQKERANVSVTLTSRLRFNDISHGPTLAAGVSLAHTVGALTKGETPMPFGALSNVPKEVRSIVQDPADGGTGPFPGKILLDKEFTAANLERSLSQGASTVHIATHFSLDATGDDGSFFLLGDGTQLPLSQWKEALKLKGVGLLTLSACETGVGSADATGGEVSSIGEVSQYLGAQSVIVSLWPVADSSTADLMKDFYSRLHDAPEQGKAQALREAQRALLGNEAATPLAQGERGRPQQEDGSDTSTLPFVKDPKHPYAHPFYWAPFSLIGNWK